MRRVTCSRVLKGSLCALLFALLSAGLFLWVYVESASGAGERAARLRGCPLCHSAETPLSPALRQWQPGAPITPILRAELRRAHPRLSRGAETELTDWLVAGSLPKLAAARQTAPGAALYRAKCAACHGNDGNGQPGLYPPLRGSEWLTATPSRLPEILTQGLQGPISVKGTPWNAIMLPPGLADENEVQAVIDYLRATFSR